MGHVWKQRHQVYVEKGEEGLRDLYEKECKVSGDKVNFLEKDTTLASEII